MIKREKKRNIKEKNLKGCSIKAAHNLCVKSTLKSILAAQIFQNFIMSISIDIRLSTQNSKETLQKFIKTDRTENPPQAYADQFYSLTVKFTPKV